MVNSPERQWDEESAGGDPRRGEKGYQEDRCALYVWRTAVYYAEHESRDAAKLKWWYWKDRAYPSEREENHESAE